MAIIMQEVVAASSYQGNVVTVNTSREISLLHVNDKYRFKRTINIIVK